MYLKQLTLQGFKTFANKTTLRFPPRQVGANHHPLTVIVGPNGSGKSNIADAIRWCLGEQSMKQLRSKKSHDVIFSGSEGKGRSNVAEVSLEFDNPKHIAGIELSEIVITRRLYRDGESDYLLNGKSVRLQDIQLLLAEAGIGQRTYTVIAQGMIDHILTSTPEERKVFFDDATGVRGLQMKREQAMTKLRRSTEHMVEVERLIAEMEPRLALLKKQLKRLEEREEVEAALSEVQQLYYTSLWREQQEAIDAFEGQIAAIDRDIRDASEQIAQGDERLARLEKEQATQSSKPNHEKQEAQQAYTQAQRAFRSSQQAVFDAQRELEIHKVRAQSRWAPLPLQEIVTELDAILSKEASITVGDLLKLIKNLKTRLTKPKPEELEIDPALTQALESATKQATQAKAEVERLETVLSKLSEQESAPQPIKAEFFDLQRQLREAQGQLHMLEAQKNAVLIEKTRIDTRREDLLSDIRELGITLQTEASVADKSIHLLKERMLQLQRKKELIGGIDEEIVQEHHEVQERHAFLTTHLTDLKEAIQSSETLIDSLDTEIKTQSEQVFAEINERFQFYFKVLFGGGSCSLLKLEQVEEAGIEVTPERAIHDLIDRIDVPRTESEAILDRFEARVDAVAGIDIEATPPGKKLRSLHALSGGERALTSIALLSAIMAINPSPFVVLDEVDAALDEANTVRFANILHELRKLTQFIVVTHNRATMERGDLLYGVTMGGDGISSLLSVNMEEISESGSSRR